MYRGAKNRAELSELIQTEPSRDDLIQASSTEQIPLSPYIWLYVEIGRRSAPQSILLQGITEMGGEESLE